MLSVTTLRGPERFAHIAKARLEFIVLCSRAGIGSTTIGKVLHRDQDTIRYHLQREKFVTRRRRYRERLAAAQQLEAA